MSRNPAYYDFSRIGGDCTNFASQCLYAGCNQMNYTKTLGWYYVNANNRAPAWTGVEYFYRFLVNNQGIGPFARRCNIDELMLGDFIQLGNMQGYYHTLMVVDIDGATIADNIYIATHTFDAYMRKLSSYQYYQARYIHIEGARIWFT